MDKRIEIWNILHDGEITETAKADRQKSDEEPQP